jgi:ATP-binding cassette, subfamily B (MDR/TAP), member 1
MFSETINLLFRKVDLCSEEDDAVPPTVGSCAQYWDIQAASMRERSFVLSGYWIVVVAVCLIGNVLTFYGFGMASERMNKRIRDMSFCSLLRQEVGFFDKRSVGCLTSQLQDDAAKLQSFSGDPLRVFVTATSAVLTSVLLSFIVRGSLKLLRVLRDLHLFR